MTSDHGEEFGEHGEWTHETNLYDTTTKVPLMMYVPEVKNKKITQVAESVDIIPTLLNILCIKNSSAFAGINLFGDDNKEKYSIAQLDDGMATIRDNEWKLFYKIENNKPMGVRLFNYKRDPQEKDNIIFTNNTGLLKNVPK